MKRFGLAAAITFATLIGLSGCDALLSVLGISVNSVDLTVAIAFAGEEIIVTVRNEGSPSVAKVPFSIYLSSDATISQSDYSVLSSFVDVGAGLSTPSTVATADLSLAEVPDGEYLVGVIVDPENLFEEDQ